LRPGANMEKQAKSRAEVTHRRIATNGIHLEVAEAGDGTPVVMLHGFLEIGHSWRYQLPALAAAGYHGVAPDLRGYGGSDAPEPTEAYAMREMLDDIVGLLDALGEDRAVIAGHDWGANIAWAFGELHPDRTSALVVLSVPYKQRFPDRPTTMLRRFAGDHFEFTLYFQEPGVAERELEADIRSTIRRFMYSFSGDAPAGLLDRLFREKPADAHVLDGMIDPPELPAWLTEADLDVYVRAYEHAGFRGALNRYRNVDRDWEELPQLGTTGIRCPVLFMAGDRDPPIMYGNLDAMRASVPLLRDAIILPGCGHWTHQERSERVNEAMMAFLAAERV
jgi:epoxide hydrolase A/B